MKKFQVQYYSSERVLYETLLEIGADTEEEAVRMARSYAFGSIGDDKHVKHIDTSSVDYVPLPDTVDDFIEEVGFYKFDLDYVEEIIPEKPIISEIRDRKEFYLSKVKEMDNMLKDLGAQERK